MGSAGTVWMSTLVVCLLAVCTACGRHPFIARHDRPLRSIPPSRPVIPRKKGPLPSRGERLDAGLGRIRVGISRADEDLAGLDEGMVWENEFSPPAHDGVGRTGWGDAFADRRIRPRRRLGRRLADRLARRRPAIYSTFRELFGKIPGDCENYYAWDSTADLLLGLAGASVLANTSLDQDFQDWYQGDVWSEGTDDFAKVWRRCGDGRYIVPAFGFMAVIGRKYDHTPCGSVLGELGFRTERAYLVGTPSMLFLQYCLGAARPGESRYESRWTPFEECHGVSGHAFIGAVPLITAAQMTENPWLKTGFYACSLLPTWCRLDQNSHYLSQCWLGWWMAYLACRAVSNTDRQFDQLAFAPVATPDLVGIGAVYER